MTFKLYLQKLGKGILYFIFVILLYSLIGGVLMTVINAFIPWELLRSYCYLIVPVFLVALFTYKRRQNRTETRRAYLAELGEIPFSFGAELTKILKSGDFLAELAAFCTLMLVLFISNIVHNPISAIISLLTYLVFFLFIDVLIWLLLHRSWAGERIHKM